MQTWNSRIQFRRSSEILIFKFSRISKKNVYVPLFVFFYSNFIECLLEHSRKIKNVSENSKTTIFHKVLNNFLKNNIEKVCFFFELWVQLNLLYEQCRDSIIKEEYPVTRKVAAELAGIQSCILHGFFDAKKHAGSFKLELADMFPEVFLKNNKKAVEKEIRNEWSGVTDSEQSKATVRKMK